MALRSEKSAEAQHLCQPEDLLAATAAIMADKSRARMLCVLMDGRAAYYHARLSASCQNLL
ncbi:hypothetical protein K6958_15885 [Mixta hanseatica]|uniref:Transcriptional regulator n=1 Tax=Mixta hanseatica TaxID=2872648 RepID=A0ABY4R6V0_9GAMM|nr:hypothetical protein K6958_15885 [Mixta hanseatica]